jgi:hypothetical protein
MDVIAHYRRKVSKFVDWMEVSKCVCYVHILKAGHIRTVESSPLNQELSTYFYFWGSCNEVSSSTSG